MRGAAFRLEPDHGKGRDQSAGYGEIMQPADVEPGVCMGHAPQKQRDVSQDRRFREKGDPGNCADPHDGEKQSSPLQFLQSSGKIPGHRQAGILLQQFKSQPERRICKEQDCPGKGLPVRLQFRQFHAGQPFSPDKAERKQRSQAHRKTRPPHVPLKQHCCRKDQAQSRRDIQRYPGEQHRRRITDHKNRHFFTLLLRSRFLQAK